LAVDWKKRDRISKQRQNKHNRRPNADTKNAQAKKKTPSHCQSLTNGPEKSKRIHAAYGNEK
jgi:hypothetical protein